MSKYEIGTMSMEEFVTNDGVTIKYIATDSKDLEKKAGKEILILLHGFTGSSAVWQRNIPTLADKYRVIVPDLRGHGESGKPKHGYHVSRLAMDLQELIVQIKNASEGQALTFHAIGGSLGCAILWSHAELFGASTFQNVIFVDQSPLQNSTLDGWDSRFCNRGMNNPWAVASLQKTLELAPELAHRGTIAACLGYRYAPLEDEEVVRTQKEKDDDEAFFLREALKGDGRWLGKLMEDHTSKDWRDSIRACFGPESKSLTKALVVGSSRSGCFPAEGVMKIVEFINGEEHEENKKAEGVVVDWGGHWCYWEDPKKFNDLAPPLRFLISPHSRSGLRASSLASTSASPSPSVSPSPSPSPSPSAPALALALALAFALALAAHGLRFLLCGFTLWINIGEFMFTVLVQQLYCRIFGFSLTEGITFFKFLAAVVIVTKEIV
ncbi:hypothetical protein EYC80_006503 [Monilinia laxa]|uniref:AB hydrolase-1 domain-containing protein n=1 Tax=Monilinia laxa TaxID=61186 RepID=A0A5N6JSW5_MONLA|nr:hypothetical protein EYC80_006503 [Monilinia laxa]